MSTVVWDGRALAADGLARWANTIVTGGEAKIRSRGPGEAVAIVGGPVSIVAVAEWAFKDQLAKHAPSGDWSVIRYRFNGPPEVAGSNAPHWDPVPTPFAMGSGMEFALGALKAGANAIEAVTIACELDPDSGGELLCWVPEKGFVDDVAGEAEEKLWRRVPLEPTPGEAPFDGGYVLLADEAFRIGFLVAAWDGEVWTPEPYASSEAAWSWMPAFWAPLQAPPDGVSAKGER